MPSVAQTIIKIAKAEVGYHEGRSNGHWNNREKYAAQVPGMAWVSAQGQPWCATFVSWAALKADAADLYPRTASTDIGAAWFKQRGQWSEYPAIGAQVFYGVRGDMNHTGLVVDFDDTFITTVEGNTNTNGSREGDGVYLKKRRRRDDYVQGYGYPAFPEGIVSADPRFINKQREPKVIPTPVAPEPQPKTPRIQKAVAVANAPSDHKIVWAELSVKGTVFKVATANVRATPPMRPANVQRCVTKALCVGATIVGFNEFQGRRLDTLLPEGWAALQGPKGDPARAPIAYNTNIWTLVRWENPRLSERQVATRIGRIAVPSGNRDATLAILQHTESGIEIAVNSFHAIAHFNVGAGYGWTGKGPKVLLKLRKRIANPAITVFRTGQFRLEKLINRTLPEVDAFVDMGDRNFDAFADLRALAKHKALYWGPHRTYRRLGGVSIYSTKHLTHGTAGSRGIDYIALIPGKKA